LDLKFGGLEVAKFKFVSSLVVVVYLRLLLAGLHYNENADRNQRVNNAGELVYRVRFPKFKKGGYTVSPVKEDATFGIFMYLLPYFVKNLFFAALLYSQLNSQTYVCSHLPYYCLLVHVDVDEKMVIHLLVHVI